MKRIPRSAHPIYRPISWELVTDSQNKVRSFSRQKSLSYAIAGGAQKGPTNQKDTKNTRANPVIITL